MTLRLSALVQLGAFALVAASCADGSVSSGRGRRDGSAPPQDGGQAGNGGSGGGGGSAGGGGSGSGGSGGGGSATDAGSKESGGADGAAGAPGAECKFDGNTGIKSAKEMFDYVNKTRVSYAVHDPFDGYPWMGSYVTGRTWALSLAWDDALAGDAQKEADRLAAGGAPTGSPFAFTNHQLAPKYEYETFYLSGLDTARYQLAARSVYTISAPGPTFAADGMKWHLASNGSARQGIFYQTGSAPHATKTRMGVGMACVGTSGDVWWVILIGD